MQFSLLEGSSKVYGLLLLSDFAGDSMSDHMRLYFLADDWELRVASDDPLPTTPNNRKCLKIDWKSKRSTLNQLFHSVDVVQWSIRNHQQPAPCCCITGPIIRTYYHLTCPARVSKSKNGRHFSITTSVSWWSEGKTKTEHSFVLPKVRFMSVDIWKSQIYVDYV